MIEDGMEKMKEAASSHRILFVTHIDFWKRDLGSRMRLYKMLEYLTGYFLVTIAYIGKREPGAKAELEEIGYLNRVIYIDEMEESEVDANKIALFLQDYPILNPFYDLHLYKKMQTFLDQTDFDSVIVEYLHLSYFLHYF